jgi:hypothetical protein
MKAQMLLSTFLAATLVMGALITLAGAGRWNSAALYALSPALAAAVAFLATTIPFTRKAWRKDRLVALAAPFLLLGRALALSAGSAWGLLRPRRNLDGWPASRR